MSDPRPLTKVQHRLLAELLAYRDDMRSDTGSTASDRHETVATYRERVLRYECHHGRRSRLRRVPLAGVVLATFVVAAMVLVQVVPDSGSRAFAATPPALVYHVDSAQSGRQVLLQLATVAAKQRARSQRAGDTYAYVKSAGWYLGTRVHGAASSSTVVPTITESWMRADGSGRILRMSASTRGPRVSETTAPLFRDDFTVPAGHPLANLSADPAVVAQQLDVGHPERIGPVERFVALTDLSLAQPVPATVESAILRALATSPGLINSGAVADRVGRSGVSVSLDSAYSGLLTRYTLIFDPGTGRLLGEEETLIGDPRRLDVRSPAVLAYTVFLSSGYVDSVTTRP